MARLQTRIREIKAVHDLIVLVVGRLASVAGKRVHIRPLEINDPATLLVEERVLGGVVKVVSVILFSGVGNNFTRARPRALRSFRLAVPHLPEHSCTEHLGSDHDVTLAVLVPKTGAIVENNWGARGCILKAKRGLLPVDSTSLFQLLLLLGVQRRSTALPAPNQPTLSIVLEFGLIFA